MAENMSKYMRFSFMLTRSNFCGKCGAPVNQTQPQPQPQARICQGCGSTLEDGLIFCRSCGKKCEEASPVSAQFNHPTTPPVQPFHSDQYGAQTPPNTPFYAQTPTYNIPAPPAKQKSSLPAVIIAVVVALAIFSVIVYLILDKQSDYRDTSGNSGQQTAAGNDGLSNQNSENSLVGVWTIKSSSIYTLEDGTIYDPCGGYAGTGKAFVEYKSDGTYKTVFYIDGLAQTLDTGTFKVNGNVYTETSDYVAATITGTITFSGDTVTFFIESFPSPIGFLPNYEMVLQKT